MDNWLNKGLLDIVDHSKVYWHETTPKNFACEAGCGCCCGNTYFFPSEYEKLPNTVLKKVEAERLGEDILFKPVFINNIYGDNVSCVFLNSDLKNFGCTLSKKHRPLRCQIYPYIPVIVGNKIVMLAEPYTTLFKRAVEEPFDICYGLGKGPDISKSMARRAKKYLRMVINEYPFLLSLLFYDDMSEIPFDKKGIGFHTNPLYSSWKTMVKERGLKKIDRTTFKILELEGNLNQMKKKNLNTSIVQKIFQRGIRLRKSNDERWLFRVRVTRDQSIVVNSYLNLGVQMGGNAGSVYYPKIIPGILRPERAFEVLRPVYNEKAGYFTENIDKEEGLKAIEMLHEVVLCIEGSNDG